jgi:8-oxo-dGTP pyrophosphatase MutT (NUDIX family)
VTESAITGRFRRGGHQIIPRPQHWTFEDDPPWPIGATWPVEEVVAAVPQHSAPELPTFPGAKMSAVLIALAPGDQGAQVLLTRRSQQMRNHRGEMSFPGGRCDPGETPAVTAVREAEEEVGLDPSLPHLVGELDHLSTIVSRSYIVPIVARVDDAVAVAPRTFEADRAMWVSLSELTRPGTYRREFWGRPPMRRPLHFFELDDETIWGATGHMLHELLARTHRAASAR